VCGIAGILGDIPSGILAEMSAGIAHRGPDGDGSWYDPLARIGLVHRRLSIIDLSAAAAQPMASCAGRYQVVFNGEIYNFRSLAAELEARGYCFNRNSDTAVLAPLYDRLGPAMLEKLNGIFAFAIWDARRRELFIARDGLGIKPLYYALTAKGLGFASELKALLPLPDIDRTVDSKAIADYLVYLWSAGERTPLRGISKLLPGHYLKATASSFEIVQWYRQPAAARALDSMSSTVIVGRLAAEFDEAVAEQCVSDVPLGAFLSGGVDSSAIVAAMVATGHRPAKTYCIGFEQGSMVEEGFGDDLAYARRFADRIGVYLTPVIMPEPEACDLAALAWMLDEPQADASPLYVAAISQVARADGIKVLMSGVGGDDLFSGYRRHRVAALRSRFARSPEMVARLLKLARAGAGAVARPVQRRIAKLDYVSVSDDEEFLLRAFEFSRRQHGLDCLAADVCAAARAAGPNRLERGVEATRGLALVDRMLLMEQLGFLPDHNLNYTDKASMTHGVEVRVPFLDQRLVALAARIPWQLKSSVLHDKWVLKQALAHRLPREILRRKKTGFGGPVHRWMTGSMLPLVRDTLASRAFRERGLIEPATVASRLEDTLAGRHDHSYLILSVLMLELWMRAFVDRASARLTGPTAVVAA
jgi:asparagine synthase (glutamine-hydrolysing)